MAKKFIENIQKLIDNKDPIRNVGNVSTGRPQSFKFEPVNLVSPPLEEPVEAPEIIINPNLIWFKSLFQFDRGNFFDLSLSDFNTALTTIESQIVSNNGNFQDLNDEVNANVMYQTSIRVTDATNINLTVIDFQVGSLAIIIKFLTDDPIKIFTSGAESRYIDGVISLPISKAGFWTITILTYHKATQSGVRILGNLGSYVSSTESPEVLPPKRVNPTLTRGINAFESVFVDGANGPTLSNLIYWDRFSSSSSTDSDRGGVSIKGYGLYHIVNERLGFDVVSGWGTDAFAISGSQLPSFPMAATLGIPGPIGVTYQVSGTQYDAGADRTIVTVSGTAFQGAKFDSIYMERTINLTDITQDSTSGDVISGTHFNVKAGDQYTYEVDTFNAAGRGPRSTRISGTAGNLVPPGLVTSLAGTGSLKAIRLTWTNPSDTDLKGIHIWDVDTIVSGTTKPIKTIIKGSNTTIPECVVIDEVSSGTLIDVWPYKLYASTYDYAGNESTEAMPTVTVTTNVDVMTAREGQRITFDSVLNQLRFFDSNDILIAKIGENLFDSKDGLQITTENGVVALEDGTHLRVSHVDNDVNTEPVTINQTWTASRSASATTVSALHSIVGLTTFVQPQPSIAIQGEVTVDPKNTEVRAIWGVVDGDQHNYYSGYFTGAQLFVEKNLIVSGSGGIKASSGFQDLDGDTKIQVEESTDENIIRFDTAGSERMRIGATGNVGIGAGTIDDLFHIQTGNDLSLIVENTQTDADTTRFCELFLKGQDDTPFDRGWKIRNLPDDSQNRLDIIFWNGTDFPKLTIQQDGNVSIGTTTASTAKLTVDQSSTTDAIPVLYLDQADISEEMIEFNTTIGTGNAIEAIGAKTLTTTHFIKVTLPGGLTRYIPCGTIA